MTLCSTLGRGILPWVCEWDFRVLDRHHRHKTVGSGGLPCLDESLQVWLLAVFGFTHPPFYWGGGVAHGTLFQRELGFKLYFLSPHPTAAWAFFGASRDLVQPPLPHALILQVGKLRPRQGVGAGLQSHS